MIPLDRIAPLDACQVLSAEEITRVKDALQDADRLKQVLSEILPWQKPEDAPTETPVQRAPGGGIVLFTEPSCGPSALEGTPDVSAGATNAKELMNVLIPFAE